MADVSGLPTAELRASRRVSAAWIVPILALVFAGWLVYRAWSMRGLTVTIQLADGHGIEPGHEVRYLGITVGDVRDVTLAAGLDGVVVTARLQPDARGLARAGSRFWVVRPELALDRVTGLETIVGPRYLAVLPGEGEISTRFVGLSAPPAVQEVQPGDLEIVLVAAERGSLQVGAPVLYRRVRVGTVLSVGLSSDAGAVEARLHVAARYAQLVRPETVFWPVGGIRADLGIKGFSLELESLRTVLVGGVALATPPDAAPQVHTGHRFSLLDAPPDGWLGWHPMAVIGSDLLPAGAALPDPLRVTIGWRQGWLFKGRRSRQGWVLPTAGGLLGPEDLLVAGTDAAERSAELEVAGGTIAIDGAPDWSAGRLALRAATLDAPTWPTAAIRAPEAPEDCLIVADRSAGHAPLAVSRLEVGEDRRWSVDPAVPLGPQWHGASVLSRADGRLIGILLVGDDEAGAAIVPVPAALIAHLGGN